MILKILGSSEFEEDISSPKEQWALYPWLGLVAGIAVLGQLYLQASQMHVNALFERFWLGMFLFFIPAFWRLLSSRLSRSERITLLTAAALFSYLPKLFRCPYYFCYSDELTWWRGVQNLLEGSPVISDNPLGLIMGAFPGLPLLTITLQKISGLSTFQVGLALMGMMRVISTLSIFLIGEKLFHSGKVGAAAALVYMMNANYLFFSSQFSYESLAVPLLLFALLFLLYLLEGVDDKSNNAWSIVVVGIISAIVITHHLATYMLIVILLLMAILPKLFPRFTLLKSPRQLYYITIFTIITGVGWIYFTHTDVVEYLIDPISRGMGQIANLTIRRFFLGISLPWYEIVSGYISAVLIGLLALYGALVLYHKRLITHAAHVGLLAFGSLYILTAPLVLTAWGAESGRRSWVYSFISLALLAGCALTWLISSNFAGNQDRGERLGRIAATIFLTVLLMGGIATSTTISYRFPGEYLQNSDARSFTPEIIDAAQWLLDQAGPDNRILGDRTTERVFGSYGLQQPAMYGGPRPWEVFFPTSWTSAPLSWLEKANAPFVVVDKRMAELPPQMDFRFQRDEPPNNFSDRPLPVQSVNKFDELPSSDRIYDSGNIRIYYLHGEGQNIYTLGQSMAFTSVQNPVDTNFDFEYRFDTILILLSVVIRSFFLIPFFLIGSGYVIGYRLFPNWSSLEIVTRILLAIAMSMSFIIITSTLLALLISNAVLAVIITVSLLVLVLIVEFTSWVASPDKYPTKNNFTFLRQVLDKINWRQQSTWILLTGLLSILLVIFLMGEIKPRYEPRTDLALDFSSATPYVQVTNHETEQNEYQLIIRNDKKNARLSLILDKDQSFMLNLSLLFPYLSSQGRINVDLYVGDHTEVYRSLHFLMEELPKESYLIPESSP